MHSASPPQPLSPHVISLASNGRLFCSRSCAGMFRRRSLGCARAAGMPGCTEGGHGGPPRRCAPKKGDAPSRPPPPARASDNLLCFTHTHSRRLAQHQRASGRALCQLAALRCAAGAAQTPHCCSPQLRPRAHVGPAAWQQHRLALGASRLHWPRGQRALSSKGPAGCQVGAVSSAGYSAAGVGLHGLETPW
jgi:hypothetical protein